MFPNQFGGFSPFGGGGGGGMGPWGDNPMMQGQPQQQQQPAQPWGAPGLMGMMQQMQMASAMRFQMEQQHQVHFAASHFGGQTHFRPRGGGHGGPMVAQSTPRPPLLANPAGLLPRQSKEPEAAKQIKEQVSKVTASPEAATAAAASATTKAELGSKVWVCQTCQVNNWKDRQLCFKCKKPKPSATSDSSMHTSSSSNEADNSKKLLDASSANPANASSPSLPNQQQKQKPSVPPSPSDSQQGQSLQKPSQSADARQTDGGQTPKQQQQKSSASQSASHNLQGQVLYQKDLPVPHQRAQQQQQSSSSTQPSTSPLGHQPRQFQQKKENEPESRFVKGLPVPTAAATSSMEARNKPQDSAQDDVLGAGKSWNAEERRRRGYSDNKSLHEDKASRISGDWDCPACRFMNFARRIDCKMCLTPKPWDVARVPEQSQQKAEDFNAFRSASSMTSTSAYPQEKQLQPHQERFDDDQLQEEYEKEHEMFQSKDQLSENSSRFRGMPGTGQSHPHQQLSIWSHQARKETEFSSRLNEQRFSTSQQNASVSGQQSGTELIGSSTSTKPLLTESSLGLEQTKILQKEAEFDKVFEQWERNFALWKLQNEHNPDKGYVQKHIDEMDQLRERMISRREALRQQRCALLARQTHDVTNRHPEVEPQTNNAFRGDGGGGNTARPRDGPVSRWRSNDDDYAGYDSQRGDPSFGSWANEERSPWNSSRGDGMLNKFQQDKSIYFSNSKSSAAASNVGIPGLGDGEDTSSQEDSNKQEQLSRQDRETISRTVRALDRPYKRAADLKRKSEMSWSQQQQQQQQQGEERGSRDDDGGSASLWMRRDDAQLGNRVPEEVYFQRSFKLGEFNPTKMFERRGIAGDNSWESQREVIEYGDPHAPRQAEVTDYAARQDHDAPAPKLPRVIDYSHGGGGKDDQTPISDKVSDVDANWQQMDPRSFAAQQKQVFDYSSPATAKDPHPHPRGNEDAGHLDSFLPRPVPSSSLPFSNKERSYQQPQDRRGFNRESGAYRDIQEEKEHSALNFPRPVPTAQVNLFEHADRSFPPSRINNGGQDHSLGWDRQASGSRHLRHAGAAEPRQSSRVSHSGNSWPDDDRFEKERKQQFHCERTDLKAPVTAPPPPPPPPPPPLAPRGELVQLSDLLEPPGRYVRPPKLVLILRGLPGSGKSLLCKSIKANESELGSDPPRVLCLDDYFECDGKYEYEADLEPSFRSSLVKSFKKNIDDGFFAFMVVDCVNDKTKHYEEMWSYAKQRGFEVYIAEMDCDPNLCHSRNIHDRDLADIERLFEGWEATPLHFNRADMRGFLQDKEVTDVVMTDAMDDEEEEETKEDGTERDKEDEEEEDSTEASHFKLSKWEIMDNDLKMAQLDGVSARARKRVAEHASRTHDSIEDWLELSKEKANVIPGKKRVRWADIEEQRAQVKMRQVGFVVGQTNWNRMMDPSQGESALTQTKIIPNRFDDNP